MTRGTRPAAAAGLAALLLGVVVTAGCNKGGDEGTNLPSSGGGPSAGSAGRIGGGPPGSGGPGGPPGPGGGRRGGMGRGPGGPGGAPVAADATGEQIYQAKCQGCHGANGAGGKAPVLTAGGGKSDDDLFKVIHDGKGKMPAFAGQLSDDQIKKVVASVKSFK